MSCRLWSRIGAARFGFGLAAAFVAGPALAAVDRAAPAASGTDWIQSPYRHFRAGEPVADGRAVIFDENDEPSLHAAIGSVIGFLEQDLFERQGWKSPFSPDEPLRV